MSGELGKEDGFMKTKVETEEDQYMAPIKKWQFYDRFQVLWKSDPTLAACEQHILELISRHLF